MEAKDANDLNCYFSIKKNRLRKMDLLLPDYIAKQYSPLLTTKRLIYNSLASHLRKYNEKQLILKSRNVHTHMYSPGISTQISEDLLRTTTAQASLNIPINKTDIRRTTKLFSKLVKDKMPIQSLSNKKTAHNKFSGLIRKIANKNQNTALPAVTRSSVSKLRDIEGIKKIREKKVVDEFLKGKTKERRGNPLKVLNPPALFSQHCITCGEPNIRVLNYDILI